jgi:hypothetical protein
VTDEPDEEPPSVAEQVDVLHSLTDQRVNLSGGEVMEVADMSFEQRRDLLAKVVERAEAAALQEYLERKLAKRRRDG